MGGTLRSPVVWLPAGRGCHDAIEAVFQTASGKGATRLWCLDFDLEAAFDHIDHDHLLSLLAGFPGLGLVRKWLKAGVVENGVLSPTEEGTPQGGGISPVLLNVALHGMEEAAGVRYMTTGVNAGKTWPGSPVLVRYADLCRARHKSAYAEDRIMPTRSGSCLFRALGGFLLSA